MAAKAYYNEIDPHAAQWLRNLIAAGVIAPGVVDERDIRDVKPDDLKGFAQCHFFSGVGVWSYALRQAGWPDDRPCFSGSCPCQSFSAAGKRAGFADERHLWPAFFHLIEVCRPPVVFGEQVASKAGLAWLDLVHADLEGANYACGAFDLCAAGVGAPQIRQRLYFVANSSRARTGRNTGATADAFRQSAGQGDRDRQYEAYGIVPRSSDGVVAGAEGERLLGRQDDRDEGRRQRASGQGREAGELVTACQRFDCCAYPDECGDPNECCERARREAKTEDEWDVGELEHAARDGRVKWRTEPSERSVIGGCGAGELGDADEPGLEGWGLPERGRPDECASRASSDLVRPGSTNGFWRDADWIFCTDGKWRPAQPLPQQMVDGPAADLGCVRADQDTGFPLIGREAFGAGGVFEGKSRAKMLRGYGNAIVAPLATEFIKAAMECLP